MNYIKLLIVASAIIFGTTSILPADQSYDQKEESAQTIRAPREGTNPPISGAPTCDLSSILLAIDRLEQQINDLNVSGSILVDITGSCTNVSLTFTTFEITFTAVDTACTATPVFAPTTFTEPGFYCLANDVDGTFIVAADDVIFDLGGHTISNGVIGIIISTGTNRIIRNGRIDSQTLGGIVAQDTTATQLENLTITNCGTAITHAAVTLSGANSNSIIKDLASINCPTGVNIQGPNAQAILINNLSFTGNFIGRGIVGDSLSNLTVRNSTMSNSLNGILLSNADTILLDTIESTSSTSDNITVTLSTDIVVQNIIVGSAPQALVISDVAQALVKNVQAFNCGSPLAANLEAISALFSSEIQFINCAVRNYVGTNLPNGFLINGCNNVVLQDCLSQQVIGLTNSSNGFEILNSDSIYLTGCSAIDITSLGTDANGFAIIGSNNINLLECTALTCTAVTAAGFNIQSGNIALSYCYTASCKTTLGGYIINTSDNLPVSLQYCQSNWNTGDGYHLNNAGNIVIGNSIAISNELNGFNGVAGIPVLYNNFATNNALNQYNGTAIVNVNNASDQVNPAILAPNGPFAAGNIQI